MFTFISKTGVGMYITLIETVLSLFGIQFESGSVENAVNGLVYFVGFILLIWGQLARSDLNVGLVRKDPRK